MNYLQQIKDYAVGFLPIEQLTTASNSQSYIQAIGLIPRPAGQILENIVQAKSFTLHAERQVTLSKCLVFALNVEAQLPMKQPYTFLVIDFSRFFFLRLLYITRNH